MHVSLDDARRNRTRESTIVTGVICQARVNRKRGKEKGIMKCGGSQSFAMTVDSVLQPSEMYLHCVLVA